MKLVTKNTLRSSINKKNTEDIIMIRSQRKDAEKEKLIEEAKRIGINIIIKRNNGNSQSQTIFFCL